MLIYKIFVSKKLKQITEILNMNAWKIYFHIAAPIWTKALLLPSI